MRPWAELNTAREEAARARDFAVAAQARIERLEAERSWWRRFQETPQLADERESLAGWEEKAVAAGERVRSLEHELERRGADGPVTEARREQVEAIRSELDRRREAQIQAALIEPGDHITRELGERPADAHGRWM